MKKEIVVLLEDKDALDIIRSRFNIEEKRFLMGVDFASKILDGDMSKNLAYVEAFGVDKETARTLSSQLHRAKWIQELLRYLRPDQDTLYTGEIKDIIKNGMEIIRDNRASNRDKSEAMKALQPYLKEEKLRLEVDITHEVKESTSVVTKLNDKILQLASIGKMLNEAGDIIDVELIE